MSAVRERMFVTGIGMACPVGLDAASACAAQRAGISALAELPWLDNAGEPIIGAMVPGLDDGLPRGARLLELALLSISELAARRGGVAWQRVPLLLCLAEPERPGAPADNQRLAQTLVDQAHERLGMHFHPELSRVFAGGHTAAFRALAHARALMAREQAPACLVCAVDSLLNAATLQWLSTNDRLKTELQRDGLSPGEAAAAVLVEPQPHEGSRVEVLGLGFGAEEATVASGLPQLGRGLAAAARSALDEARRGLHEIDLRLSDVSGELHGFKELPLLQARVMRVVRKADQPLWHWAETIGDTGAAAGLAQLVLADQAFRKDYAPGPLALGLGSAWHGDRAAAVLGHCAPRGASDGL